MVKSIVKIIAFLVILFTVLFATNKIFKFKYGDGIYDMTEFYKLPRNTVDVIILGSSHAFLNINPIVLWTEKGIASYVLGGSVQPMWNTYYYLKEAFKTQKPKLIILEAYTTTFANEYIDDSRIIKNTYGMKWSKDKIEAIKISAPQERWKNFFLDYAQYHSRYKELSSLDFSWLSKSKQNLWLGAGCALKTNTLKQKDISNVIEHRPMYEKTETYFRKTIELAKENNIPILIIKSPYADISVAQQEIYNAVEEMVNTEYGLPFINYNLFNYKTEINYETDAQDGSHLNFKGAKKFTTVLADDIKQLFDIPDRRGDTNYCTWENETTRFKEFLTKNEIDYDY